MKNYSLVYLMIATLLFFNACKDKDDDSFNTPTVTAPATQNLLHEESVELSFSYIAEAGFKMANVVATNGTAAITTDGTISATSGTIVVTYTAGSQNGAGSVAQTITDKQNQIFTATCIINILEEQIEFDVTENITANTTWETGKIYILKNRIAVESGALLTIQAGTIIKGEAGTGANATALIIARGAQILADGTAESPIIFTSVADEIIPGQIASPNLDPDINGLWGGLIILGNAPVSASAESVQIEGIPASDPNGLYGGNNPTDNSGIIRFVSIRHGGANIGEGNEINGLTLGGVGSETTIENIEVVANQDDGIEWFGGTVNVSNALIWNVGDDAVDTDQAWAGTLNNFIILCGSETDHALEIDGPEGSLMAGHTVTNGSIKGNENSELGDFRSGARGNFNNLYFFNFPDPTVTEGRGDFSLSGDASIENFANGNLVFSNLEITLLAGIELSTVFKSGTDVHAANVTANSVGADKSQFNSWSWAATSGHLTDL